jgi:hypothetical protein
LPKNPKKRPKIAKKVENRRKSGILAQNGPFWPEKRFLMAHSPHRRWSGCQLCKPQKFRDNGRPVRDPWPVERKLGLRRRYGRHDIPEDQF